MTSIIPGSARAWLLAARPATLSAAFVPVAVGSAFAASINHFALGPALAALIGAFLIQIGTNFANDVFDFRKGADTDDRVGPTRAAQARLLSERQLFIGLILSFGLATLCGLYLTFEAGWPIVAIGIASLVSGVAYTGGPYPLGYNGLGDLFVFVFFGLVAVCGTVFVQCGFVPAAAYWAAIPVGALATNILVVNNIRDSKTDVLVGKRTLAVRFGITAARVQYSLLLAMAFIVPSLMAVLYEVGPWLHLPWISLPMALPLAKGIWQTEAPDVLNPTLKASAVLLLVHGLLFSAGLTLSGS